MSLKVNFNLQYDSFNLQSEFELEKIGITALFGHSGCGKTTLLRSIAGLESNATGHCEFDKTLWQSTTQNYTVPVHKRRIGYVFQDAALFPHLSVRKNLFYSPRNNFSGTSTPDPDNVIHILNLESLLDRPTQKLSGGEIQRVAIGRALLSNPDLLLLDEPLSALDRVSKMEILQYIECLNQDLNIPVLFVSHSIEEVARLAEYIVLMDSGRIKALGKVNDIFTRLNLPLAHEPTASAIINANVKHHDNEYNLTELEFEQHTIHIPAVYKDIGTQVKVLIHARDVSLTLVQPENTSILNILPVMIKDIQHEGTAQVMIKLAIGKQCLLARITRKSVDNLQLTTGKTVFAQVKSIALL